jgi:hypothetical protein
MKSMQKKPPPRMSKGKANTVANDSLQTRAPGAGPGSSRGNMQSGSGFGASEAGPRGGPGAQQTGWSSRQQADRIMARGEESRLGEAQQRAGSQESPTEAPTPGSGSRQ